MTGVLLFFLVLTVASVWAVLWGLRAWGRSTRTEGAQRSRRPLTPFLWLCEREYQRWAQQQRAKEDW